MTTKKRLHLLVDQLPPEREQTAREVLEALAGDPVLYTLDNAPPDDEPDDDGFDGGLTEARAEMAAGRGIPQEGVKRMFGRDPARIPASRGSLPRALRPRRCRPPAYRASRAAARGGVPMKQRSAGKGRRAWTSAKAFPCCGAECLIARIAFR
jgi:hypothetical protein